MECRSILGKHHSTNLCCTALPNRSLEYRTVTDTEVSDPSRALLTGRYTQSTWKKGVREAWTRMLLDLQRLKLRLRLRCMGMRRGQESVRDRCRCSSIKVTSLCTATVARASSSKGCQLNLSIQIIGARYSRLTCQNRERINLLEYTKIDLDIVQNLLDMQPMT